MRRQPNDSRLRDVSRLALQSAALLTAAALGGCCWPTSDKQGHTYLVIGLGFVRTHDTSSPGSADGQCDALAQRTEAAGMLMGLGPPVPGLLIGYLKRQSIEVRPDANVLIDAGDDGAGPLRVWARRVGPDDVVPQEQDRELEKTP